MNSKRYNNNNWINFNIYNEINIKKVDLEERIDKNPELSVQLAFVFETLNESLKEIELYFYNNDKEFIIYEDFLTFISNNYIHKNKNHN